MRRRLLSPALALLAAAIAVQPAHAQRRDDYVECYRDGRRVSCDDSRGDRDRERAREVARARAAQARERARREAERVRALAIARSRSRSVVVLDDDRWRDRILVAPPRRRLYDDGHPRVSLGAGADIRRFDDVNRYLATAGVDFHTRFGLGLRPEVMFAWSDRQRLTAPTAALDSASRSKMLGVTMNATYSLMRRAFVRPYLLGGIGVLSTRDAASANDRVDIGLNTGAGLEFGHGPVRLYTEFRYFLNDTPSARGFSGMLPLTAGLRF